MTEIIDPLSDMDTAFQLPIFFHEDAQDLVELYNILVSRMRRDYQASGLQTVQLLLIERICYNYILMRWKERQTDAQGFASPNQHKDFNVFWLSLISELHKQIKLNEAEFKKVIVDQVLGALTDSLKRVDSQTRAVLMDGLKKSLTARGL